MNFWKRLNSYAFLKDMPSCTSQKIDLYTRCWNDAHMLPFFFRHYDEIVNRYVVFDDGSTDGSLDILKAHPKVEIRLMPALAYPDSRVLSSKAVLENCWKSSRGRADWVIVTDIDEFIWHPDLSSYLKGMTKKGVTLIPALGFDMIADAFPEGNKSLTEELIWGAPSSLFSKVNIFSPTAIDQIQFAVGRHSATPSGSIRLPPQDELFLLHYKYIDFNRLLQRHQLYSTRYKSTDIQNKWGVQYSWDEQRLLQEWLDIKNRAVIVKTATPALWNEAIGSKWWSQL